jgi:glycosyltransferase involved in cell wall biosynthesis
MIANGLQRIVKSFGKEGIAGVRREFRAFTGRRRERKHYQRWLEKYGTLTDSRRLGIRNEIDEFERLPLISIILPVYNVDEKWLRLCVRSVVNQLYRNWELCIADDASSAAHIRPALEAYAASDPRIKIICRESNGHISAASNTALSLATGEFTVLLDHDDELAEDALFWVVKEILEHPDVRMIYSDEDVIDESGRRYDPKFKPDFARDLFYSLNLVTHLSAYKTELIRSLGGFRVGMEGSQDYDLALRVIESIDEVQIRHISKVLYHWRAIGTSVASGGEAQPYAYEKAREALRDHFKRTGTAIEIERATHDLNRVRYQLQPSTTVSVIVYGEAEDRLTQYAAGLASVEMIYAEGDDAVSLNNAADRASGDILCFLRAGLKPRDDSWLYEIAGLAAQKEVGAVGGKLVDRGGNIRRVGFVLDDEYGVVATDAGASVYPTGYFFRARLIGNFSAVAIDCFGIKKSVFTDLGGFDETFVSLFDADLCLRLRELALRIAYTPYAAMASAAPLSSATALDVERFKTKWAAYTARDPFYNPNLSHQHLFSIGD